MIANRTTSVSAVKSVSEIQAMLAEARASALTIDYSDGEPSGLSFTLTRENHSLHFRLPCNWSGTLQAMKRDKKCERRLLQPEQAKRVAWRVLRDWIRAQLTLVEAGASSIEEVMIPYLVTNDGTTVAARLFNGSSGLLALPAPPK